MSVIAIAKKDFRDAIRSRALIVLTLLFAIFTAGGAVISTQIAGILGGGGDQTTLDIVLTLQSPAGILVPIIGLLVGYRAVAGERESGSLKFLLGLPHTRRDVVLGKVLGRTGVVAVAIIVGFTVGITTIFALTGSFSPVVALGFTLITILLGLVYVSIAVGISSMTRSTTRAAIGAFGLFVFFWLLWGFAGLILLYLVEGAIAVTPTPDWYLLYSLLPPGSGYDLATAAALPENGLNMGMMGGDELPFFTEPWFGFVIFAAWIAVPLALGYWRFNRVDL